MEILTAAMTLLLIMDPLGNIPVFMSVLNQLDPQRRHRVLIPELLISLAVLLLTGMLLVAVAVQMLLSGVADYMRR